MSVTLGNSEHAITDDTTQVGQRSSVIGNKKSGTGTQEKNGAQPHRGNAGDGLNVAEAAGNDADVFITGDKNAADALMQDNGVVPIPSSDGATIQLEVLPGGN